MSAGKSYTKVVGKAREIRKWSTPETVYRLARRMFGRGVTITLSTRECKKYMILTPEDRWVHFGQMGYEDYTKHKDKDRRARYLARATKIKGKWKRDPYSANNLAIHLLW